MAKDKVQKKLLIAQEIKFARMLASNDKKARMKMLKKLRSWITIRSKSSFAFTESDFMRLWKGLYYCMWMSDKPLIQEELAESISNLVHCLETIDAALLYTRCALKTLSIEWYGIDRYRMDKFQMLVRRIVRQTFVMCKKVSWDKKWIKGVSQIIEDILLDTKGSLGLKFHITELYMEELAKISEGKIIKNIVTELLRPFALYLATMTDNREIKSVMKHVFRYLIFQSDVGLDYMDRFDAWKKAGFPRGDINAMQKIELSDEEIENDDEIQSEGESDFESKPNSERILDPRAGRIDVDLPQVPFDPKQIIDILQRYKFHPLSTTKTRRRIMQLIDEFTELAKGIMPLGVKKVDIIGSGNKETKPKNAALELLCFENKLYSDSNKRMKRKKRTELSVTMENGVEDEYEDENEDSLPKNKTKKQKKLENDIQEVDNSEDEADDKQDVKKCTAPKLKKICIEETQVDNSVHLIKKLKTKKLVKDPKIKDKKLKSKKLKTKQKNIKDLISNGIEFLTNFKQSDAVKKNKKIERNLENSGNFLNTQQLTTITESSNLDTKITCPNLGAKKRNIDKNLSAENKTINNIANITTKSFMKSPNPQRIANTTEPVAKKRVKIMLNHNTAQHKSEYIKQIRLSPAIPFDANRKPVSGVLKPSSIASPINPFYKRKLMSN